MSFDVQEYREKINEAVQFLKPQLGRKPRVGIILGTGLGDLVSEIKVEKEVPYEQIPHFPVSTVESHAGKLIIGELGGKAIVAMQGRFHYYEGYDMKQITFPVRVMAVLGIEYLLISNAAGGLNPQFRKGDLMLIDDHINLLGDNPLIGPNLDDFGPRFPDMSEPYSRQLIEIAEQAALDLKIKVQKGVFIAVPGPNLETRAEYRFMRTAGADAVGMSTIPEVIVAVHMGLKVLGISVITDLCFPDALEPAVVEEIIATANQAQPKLTAVMKEVVNRI
ncbi:MAG TPA: purine-nucleoside phosphorylase [Caldithrix abyssi]|uniref:Purine nucleoside phosphorylase n=1 Tax=Caldithrix abyssi TaxID=187145 RepID=A0A7V5PQZ2_CALAY|nr:purine-nucleoside phosphorylase [Caldithrix abyssi]